MLSPALARLVLSELLDETLTEVKTGKLVSIPMMFPVVVLSMETPELPERSLKEISKETGLGSLINPTG